MKAATGFSSNIGRPATSNVALPPGCDTRNATPDTFMPTVRAFGPNLRTNADSTIRPRTFCRAYGAVSEITRHGLQSAALVTGDATFPCARHQPVLEQSSKTRSEERRVGKEC